MESDQLAVIRRIVRRAYARVPAGPVAGVLTPSVVPLQGCPRVRR